MTLLFSNQKVVAATLILLCGTACSESTVIRTYPPNAAVTVDGTSIGVTPTVFKVPSHDVGSVYKYRIDRDGYVPVDGELRTRVSAGRIVGTIFTTGIYAIFRGFRTLPDRVEVELVPLNAGPAGNSAVPVADRLRKIQDLYDQGLITEQEYKRYRSQLLHEAAGVSLPERQ